MLIATVLDNRWIPHEPTLKQAEFLLLPDKEAFYGGAAGGGKSDALLMAALQYADEPGYAAILFRRTYQDLALPGALMDRASQWLSGTPARWREVDHCWTFPSGASLTFGYLQTEKDKYRYQSAEFQFIGFDELTQFTQTQYEFLFTRLRRLAGSMIPLRMRSASNPGGLGHEWVKQRFVNEKTREPARVFIPARLADNEYLDQEAYLLSLSELDPITRQQMLEGVWIARGPGGKFRREWFEVVPAESVPVSDYRVRYWDLAATPEGRGKDPSYTVGTLMRMRDGVFWVEDVVRLRGTPGEVERAVKFTAGRDGREVVVGIEQEPGSSGVNTIDNYKRHVLPGYAVIGNRPTGSKEVRSTPFSSASQAGNVKLVEGRWIEDWLDELEGFPDVSHEDQVDSACGAHELLTGAGRKHQEVLTYYDPVIISPY